MSEQPLVGHEAATNYLRARDRAAEDLAEDIVMGIKRRIGLTEDQYYQLRQGLSDLLAETL
jgi:hypothetical protein